MHKESFGEGKLYVLAKSSHKTPAEQASCELVWSVTVINAKVAYCESMMAMESRVKACCRNIERRLIGAELWYPLHSN